MDFIIIKDHSAFIADTYKAVHFYHLVRKADHSCTI